MDVDFFGIPFFLFEEDGVGVFVGEADDFVFDGGAVAGADTFDLATEHGGLVEVFGEVAVGFGGCPGLPGGEEGAFVEEPVVKETEGASVGFGGHDFGFVEVEGREL